MAIIQPNFQVNITRAKDRGTYIASAHFASVELGSCLPDEARDKFATLCDKFPAREGWELTLNEITCYGQMVDCN